VDAVSRDPALFELAEPLVDVWEVPIGGRIAWVPRRGGTSRGVVLRHEVDELGFFAIVRTESEEPTLDGLEIPISAGQRVARGLWR